MTPAMSLLSSSSFLAIKKLPETVKIPHAEYDQFFAGIGGDEVILKEENPDADKGPFRYVIPEIFMDLSFYEENICCMANNPKRGNPNHILPVLLDCLILTQSCATSWAV